MICFSVAVSPFKKNWNVLVKFNGAYGAILHAPGTFVDPDVDG